MAWTHFNKFRAYQGSCRSGTLQSVRHLYKVLRVRRPTAGRGGVPTHLADRFQYLYRVWYLCGPLPFRCDYGRILNGHAIGSHAGCCIGMRRCNILVTSKSYGRTVYQIDMEFFRNHNLTHNHNQIQNTLVKRYLF
jgi:hypothetical protein